MICDSASAFFKCHTREECNDRCSDENGDHAGRTPFFTLVLSLLFFGIDSGIRSVALLLPGQISARLLDKPDANYPYSHNQEITRRQARENERLWQLRAH